MNQDTDGALQVIVNVFPSNGGIPLHLHRRADEPVYVQNGELSIQVGEQTIAVSVGSLTHLPKGTPHALLNMSPRPCRVWLWFTRGPGMKEMFAALNQVTNPADMASLIPVFATYDVEFILPTDTGAIST